MSEVRKAFQEQTEGATLVAKLVKMLGWMFIVIGAVLTITVVGAMAGIPMIVMGVFMVRYLTKIMARNAATYGQATSEIAEIHEHQLQQARAAKDVPSSDHA